MFIIDVHLDLSMNALEWNRDLRLPVDVIRARERGMTDRPDRSNKEERCKLNLSSSNGVW
jgi:membrane dipeptidase